MEKLVPLGVKKMEDVVMQAQIKIPENSPVIGKTKGEIREHFGVEITHKHNPTPSTESCVEFKKDTDIIESDKFIHFSGPHKNIKKFTDEILKGY